MALLDNLGIVDYGEDITTTDNPTTMTELLGRYPGMDRIQELQNLDFQNNPRDMATGTASDFRHAAAMNELSKKATLGGLLPDVVGDTIAYGLGSLNELPDFFRGANPAMLAAGLATKNPSIMRAGLDDVSVAAGLEDDRANRLGTYGTPNTATIEDVFAKTLGYQAPGNNVVTQTASTGPFNYGTAQAADLPINSLERDFPGMSGSDIIEMMNNREFIGNQITPMAKPNVVDPNRIPGRIQEAVEPQYRIRDQLKRDFLEGGLFKDAKQSLGQTKDAFLEDVSGLRNIIGSGLGSLKDFAIDKGRMGRNLIGSAGAMALGLPGIIGSGAMTLLSGLENMFEDRQISGDGTIMDEFGRSYTADELNKQNALGGYYTDAARSSRRRTARIANMKARLAAGKKISAKNLAKLQAQEAAQEAARQAATTQMAAANKAAGRGGYQAGYGGDFMGGGGRGRGMGAADKGGSDSMGSFRDGGLASMFTRRR